MHLNFNLTRGPGRLLPSDSAPILQNGSGPHSDFLAKILGVDTLPFLCKTQFYFSFSLLFLHTLIKCHFITSLAIAQAVAFLLMVRPTRVLFQGVLFFIFLVVMHIMAMEAVKFNLFLILCIYLFPLFLYSHLKTTGAQLFSQRVMTEIKL
jgi:hypothetical protein